MTAGLLCMGWTNQSNHAANPMDDALLPLADIVGMTMPLPDFAILFSGMQKSPSEEMDAVCKASALPPLAWRRAHVAARLLGMSAHSIPAMTDAAADDAVPPFFPWLDACASMEHHAQMSKQGNTAAEVYRRGVVKALILCHAYVEKSNNKWARMKMKEWGGSFADKYLLIVAIEKMPLDGITQEVLRDHLPSVQYQIPLLEKMFSRGRVL